MLELFLLALPWMADPAYPSGPTSSVSTSLATCSRPIISVIKPEPISASASTGAIDPAIISRCLQSWELTSRDCLDRSRSEQDEFRRRIHESFNEHTLAAAERLIGRVDASDLKDRFAWRVVSQDLDEICLEAVAKDELERLFYSSVRIWLSAMQGDLQKIVVIGRNQSQATVWQCESPAQKTEIQLVHFENHVPPPPNSIVRTANVRLD